MTATYIFEGLGAALSAFLVVNALKTGKVGAGRWGFSATFERSNDPRNFWLYVFVYAAFGAWMTFRLIHPNQ